MSLFVKDLILLKLIGGIEFLLSLLNFLYSVPGLSNKLLYFAPNYVEIFPLFSWPDILFADYVLLIILNIFNILKLNIYFS